jgi:hypothetical protein
METKRGKGQPRSFANEQEFKDKFDTYIDFCIKNDKLANIAGFCVFTDITRETFYNQEQYYFDTYKKIQNLLEDYTINAKINDTFKIFYMKNKLNYRDRQEIDQTVNATVNNYKELSIEELKKLAGE